MKYVVLWIQRDLRLRDNPALSYAVQENLPVLPLFIESTHCHRPLGRASLWWLDKSLKALQYEYSSLNIPFLTKVGDPIKVFKELLEKSEVHAVYWNILFEPHAIETQKGVKDFLTDNGIKVSIHQSMLLSHPKKVLTLDGTPYKIFTSYWKKVLQISKIDEPYPLPKRMKGLDILPISPDVLSFENYSPAWSRGFDSHWKPGEKGALSRLRKFTDKLLERYALDRDLLFEKSTTMLSPSIHFGEITPRQIYHQLVSKPNRTKAERESTTKLLSELGWREFSYYLLYHFPKLPDNNYNRAFDAYPWRDNRVLFTLWQQGLTGYPVVDAGMRELWQTGTMHNRVRMITASFLTKHLNISWKEGESWFWDTLLDADLASNVTNWQWVAGCGVDAAPFFRIFNPTLQGKKFDPDGVYVKRWVPELKELPAKYIHNPWEAPDIVLGKASVTLGKTYPYPIVNHSQARTMALHAYKKLGKS